MSVVCSNGYYSVYKSNFVLVTLSPELLLPLAMSDTCGFAVVSSLYSAPVRGPLRYSAGFKHFEDSAACGMFVFYPWVYTSVCSLSSLFGL